MNKELITEIIIDVLNDSCRLRHHDNSIQINLTSDTILFGNNSEIDSMELVNILLDVEEKVSKQLNKNITLMDERAVSKKHSPFRSVETLTNYIMELFLE